MNLGHSLKQPLMCPASDLADGFEPHDMFYLRDTARDIDSSGEPDRRGRGGVPGVVRLGGYREGAIPGTSPAVQPYGFIDLLLEIFQSNGRMNRIL